MIGFNEIATPGGGGCLRKLAETYACMRLGRCGRCGNCTAAARIAVFQSYFRWRDGQRSLVVIDARRRTRTRPSFVAYAGPLLAGRGARHATNHAAAGSRVFAYLKTLDTLTYLPKHGRAFSAAELDSSL